MATNMSKKPRESEGEDSQLLHSLEKLQHFQDDLEKVDDEASDKVLEVEQKYSEIRRPLYAKRNEIIKSIPDFWLTVFLRHPGLCQLFNDEDEKVFKYLDSLEVEDFKDVKSGYSITFNFKPNPFFEDAKLTKNFTILDEGTTKITNTIIKWKEGMGPANRGEPEKKGNKRVPSEDSIFSWFNETQQKEVAYGFQDEVADIIKEDLWPHPLYYFNKGGGDDEEEEKDEEVEEEDSEEDTEEDDN